MRLLFVVDGRSPIALDWIKHFVERGDEVHLVSTYSCQPNLGFASIHFIPVAFSSLKTRPRIGPDNESPGRGLWGVRSIRFRTALRRWLAPLTLPQAALRLRKILAEIRPELVHAMRIPFEGMVAAEALATEEDCPLVVSVWGNDFTLHAPSTPWMARRTRQCLKQISGLHVDCHRDLRLAHEWGYPAGDPAIVAPGNGGVKTELFYPPYNSSAERELAVINPRGFRAYVRNDTFFKALPLVAKRWPQLKVLCPGMAGEPQAIRWVEELGLGENVELMPNLKRDEMADAFRRAAISVSPTTHDGTPNTLLEAMACGCYPIASDLESVREWITPDLNGTLFDPSDPRDLGRALIQVLEESEVRSNALVNNLRIIRERAEYSRNMKRVEEFYRRIS